MKDDKELFASDHAYDGIQEYDNPLPAWWLITFFATIIFGFHYWIHYEFGGGQTQTAELAEDLRTVQEQQRQNKGSGESEEFWASIQQNSEYKTLGQTVYAAKCAVCHGPELQGLIGPNLVDDYWIHGEGRLPQIAKLIRQGVVEKGMPVWDGQLQDKEIQALAVFITSEHGKNRLILKRRKGLRLSPTERLSMLDEFGGRNAIVPAEVRGRYRRWRDRVYLILLLIFLALPWIKINGLQALLLNIPERRFEIFGVMLMAHDVPLLFFLLASLALLLAFTTAVWGRVWCGWACPQTVFIEAVYRRIERFVEGDYIERRRLRAGPWSARKLRLWICKWTLYLLASSIFAHSFIAYFSGSDRLLAMMQNSPLHNWSYFLSVSFVTGLLMFNFGWFREQFCIIMCPYGRLQGVLMDEQSQTVYYDQKRGEPRRGYAQGNGECVACSRCVQVCPTGIDIRNGAQLECIACIACIDACDAIMMKVNKPTGLIAYRAPKPEPSLWRRPRPLVYLTLASICLVSLVFKLIMHAPYTATILRATDSPYQKINPTMVANHFKLHLSNQSRDMQEFEIAITSASRDQGLEMKLASPLISLNSGRNLQTHFFILVPTARFNSKGELPVEIEVRERRSQIIQLLKIITVGPYSSVGS